MTNYLNCVTEKMFVLWGFVGVSEYLFVYNNSRAYIMVPASENLEGTESKSIYPVPLQE